jgi:Uma2 family endonuclease
LTVFEFERQYGELKPHHEYWFGEAISKATPTWLHGLLQKIVMTLLDEAGYKSGSEVKLKISSEFQPVPDVIATSGRIDVPYPATPVDVVVEILSAEDSFQRVLRKCKLYAAWGIAVVVVIDPEEREGWVWENETQALRVASAIVLNNGRGISFQRIFDALDAALL